MSGLQLLQNIHREISASDASVAQIKATAATRAIDGTFGSTVAGPLGFKTIRWRWLRTTLG